MNLKEKTRNNFEKWNLEYPENDYDLIYDGVVDFDKWKHSRLKLLIILKEAHGGGRWSLTDFIKRDNGVLIVGGTANQATQYISPELISSKILILILSIFGIKPNNVP